MHADVSRPLVIFRGNCQAQHLAAIFAGSDLAETYVEGVDYGFIPSHRGTVTRFVELSEAQRLIDAAKRDGRPVILAQQTTPLVDPEIDDYRTLVDQVAMFPFLQFTFAAKNQYENPNFSVRRFPKLYSLDLDMIEISQKKASSAVDFREMIAARMPTEPLFHATTHPGPLLTSRLFELVAEQILPNEAEATAGVAAALLAGEGINFTNDTYLSPEAREALGFNWPTSYDLYAGMLKADETGEWDWIEQNLDALERSFGSDTLFLFAKAKYLMVRGQGEDARIPVNELLRREPGCLWFWHVALELEATINPTGARGVVDHARAVMGASPLGEKLLSGMLVRARELNLAVID